jgi:hypothetical protein
LSELVSEADAARRLGIPVEELRRRTLFKLDMPALFSPPSITASPRRQRPGFNERRAGTEIAMSRMRDAV